MRLPQTTQSRVWLGLGALGVLSVIAFAITAFSLWQDGNSPSNSASKSGNTAIPAGPGGFPTSKGTASAGKSASALAQFANGKGLNGADPFANSSGIVQNHKVTITATGDAAVYVGYRFRDGKGSDLRVINKSFSFTRTVRGSLPVAQVAVQVLNNGTYATCSIALDGVTVISSTARSSGHVTICTS